MFKINTVLLLAFTLSGCVSPAQNANGEEKQVVSQNIVDAMALCSSQYSSNQSASLEGWYLTYVVKGKATLEESVSGLVIDQSNLSSEHKVELAKLYYECVNSHAVKKKPLS
ncbi:hypothetical protein [Vibrio owensii]|uniref:hypothetical protein n=1 Tax=Vibrio owensii TaxID=696485 RepID=UPI0018F191AF|nr:hypothetical protein [Vibrio owensii]